MCIQFVCTNCYYLFTDHCKDKPAESNKNDNQATITDNVNPASDADTATVTTTINVAKLLPNQTNICPGPTRFEGRKKCETCIRVKGAIKKLENLVFQVPFLATDGLSGLEKLAGWERKDMEKTLRGRKKDWGDKAESREERRKVQERIEKMGLDGIVDERKEHQGFDMSVTPLKEDTKKEDEDGWW